MNTALILALCCAGGGLWSLRTANTTRTRLKRLLMTVVVCILMLGLPVILWLGTIQLRSIRARPAPIESESLFNGVTYDRILRTTPRPLVIHRVTVDLAAPGVSVLVTPPDAAARRFSYGELYARTTSEFLLESGVQVAINGDFYWPQHDHFPWDFYPHSGDVVELVGYAASGGQPYSEIHPTYHVMTFSEQNIPEVVFQAALEATPYNALAGMCYFVRDGKTWTDCPGSAPFRDRLDPRTVVATDLSRSQLLLFVIDGRQPFYSEGVTLDELAVLVQELGGAHALNLDGGGSSTLVIQAPDGTARVLNSPVHNRVPGRQRPVANHLGIFANPVQP